MRRSNMKRLPLQVVSLASLLCLLLVVYSGFQTTRLSAGDNLDALADGHVFDRHWDPRLFNGALGYDGSIKWRYNATGVPAGASVFEHAAVQTQVQAAFDNWDAVDAFSGVPIVPIVSFDGAATATDAFALDGENAITWKSEPISGVLAITPFWYLTAPVVLEAAGLPIGGGAYIPFPGKVGHIQPKGALTDAGMQFNSAFAWSTAAGPVSGRYDVQSVATHEAGHFVALSHSTVGLSGGPSPLSATMIPYAAVGDIEVRSLEQDDVASLLRTYARNPSPLPISQTVGDQGVIELDLKKGPACGPATGVAVWAYLSSGGLTGATRIETFSGSQLRAGLPDEPSNGSVTLNVPPLLGGESYTIYAQTFDSSNGASATALSAFRYNNTTINSNTLDPPNESRGFDHLATVDAIAAGATVDLGDIGILDCWVPVTGPAPDLQMDAVTAPAEGTLGGQISVTSDFSNQGSVDAGAFEVGFYFSPDPSITIEDVASGSICSFITLAANGEKGGVNLDHFGGAKVDQLVKG